jgi:hypothetical protein
VLLGEQQGHKIRHAPAIRALNGHGSTDGCINIGMPPARRKLLLVGYSSTLASYLFFVELLTYVKWVGDIGWPVRWISRAEAQEPIVDQLLSHLYQPAFKGRHLGRGDGLDAA